MDYVFFSAVKNTTIKVLNVSYDIACQWSIHLWERMKTLPLPMHFLYDDRKVTTLVPKFHLPAHCYVKDICWLERSRTDLLQGGAHKEMQHPEMIRDKVGISRGFLKVSLGRDKIP